MADLLEVVLEDVPQPQVTQLLMLLLSKAEVVGVHSSELTDILFENAISEQKIKYFVDYRGDAILSLKVSNLFIDDWAIPSVLMRLVKYDGQYDIDFNFDESDITDVNTKALMEKLRNYISELGRQFHVGDWFGGLEPASDEDTRYFTGTKSGPLG